jgi:flagellar protein FliJ
MKKFLFSLQSVLKVKKLKEKGAQRELSEAMREYQKAVDKLNDMREAEINSQHQIEKAKNGGNPALIGPYYTSLEGVRRNRIEQEKVLVGLNKFVDMKRNLLREAVKEKRVLEELEKKEHEQHKYQVEQHEQKFFDEISTIKHYAKTRNEG